MVEPTNQEKEIKVVLLEATKLIELEFPFDPKSPTYSYSGLSPVDGYSVELLVINGLGKGSRLIS